MTTEPLPRVPSLRLDGRRALVTGAGRGLGFGIAAGLAQAGAEVVLAARSGAEVEVAAKRLRANGATCSALALDVADSGARAAYFSGAPTFDILVNNAGTNRPMPMVDVTSADYEAVMSVNVEAAFFVAQSVARGLLAEGRGGSIINISSQMGHVGAADRVLYCTSKWALEGMTRAMAVEFAPAGIRVNSVAPTFVDTAMTASTLSDPEQRRRVLARIPMGRLAGVEDILGAVLYLASDAAAMVTGTSLLVDGGWTAP